MLIINTVTHRGIVCIDTFPKELVWGKKDTALECSNCLAYATYKNVLVGLCKNCAVFSYDSKYGNGFTSFPYTNNAYNDIAMCFGNIHPEQIINMKGLDYKQAHIDEAYSYSIYNLSLSPCGQFVACSGFDKIINIWNIITLEHKSRFEYNCTSIPSMKWLPDGETIAIYLDNSDNSICFLNINTGIKKLEIK